MSATVTTMSLPRHNREGIGFPWLRRGIAFLVLLVCPLAWVTAPPAQASTSQTLSVKGGASAWLKDGPAFSDGFGLASFTVPSQAAWPLRATLQFRGTTGRDGYRTAVVVAANGHLQVELSRINSDRETWLQKVALPGTVRPGQRLDVQGWVHGSSTVVLRARSWVDNAAKPPWQATVNDSSSSRLTGAASPAKVGIFTAGSTSVPVTVTGTVEQGATQPITATASSPKKLKASQVGVPAGTALTTHYGDITVTKAGTVLDRMDIHGFVIVRAPNVRITKSVVRGGPAKKYHLGLITNVDQPGLVVEDSDLKPQIPSVMIDGILGNNYTIRRVHIQGGVDSVKVEGDNVRVENSLLEGLNHFDHDPSQNGGATHNDNVQILRGRNIVITGTTALASDNFPILGGASWGDISVTVTNNYVDYGHCNMKFQVGGYSLTATVRGNVFGSHRTEPTCAFVAEKAVKLTATGNVFEDGRAINILRI